LSILLYPFSNYLAPGGDLTTLKTKSVEVQNVSTEMTSGYILGKGVATLVNEKLSPERYQAEFDGIKLTSRVYFYRLLRVNLRRIRG